VFGDKTCSRPREQDRLLIQHGEAVADHMASHFSRRAPQLGSPAPASGWSDAATGRSHSPGARSRV